MTMLAANAPTEVTKDPDGRDSELFDLPHDEGNLLHLFKLLFEEHYAEIVFGPCIQGAVFEIHADKPAEITMLDGYLTVDLGTWHFHLCIGEHKGTKASPTSLELANHRRVKRAAMFRTWGKSCLPASWGLRFWNGHDEQMITVFLPNPYLDSNDRFLRQPDWSRLHVWDTIRREFFGTGTRPS